MTRYWFNTRTGQVQDDEDKGQSRELLGPFATPEEAARAVEIAQERTERWDAEDADWERRGET